MYRYWVLYRKFDLNENRVIFDVDRVLCDTRGRVYPGSAWIADNVVVGQKIARQAGDESPDYKPRLGLEPQIQANLPHVLWICQSAAGRTIKAYLNGN